MKIIHLCAKAWRLYDLHRWRALDMHRLACRFCWVRVVNA